MTLAHITLATRDVAQTSQFFENTFRWRKIHQPGNIQGRAGWLEICPGQQLHLLQVEQFEPSPFEAEFGRHVALFHPHADFDDLQKRLAAAGAELIKPGRPTPFSRFFFREPNGYMFEVIDQESDVTE